MEGLGVGNINSTRRAIISLSYPLYPPGMMRRLSVGVGLGTKRKSKKKIRSTQPFLLTRITLYLLPNYPPWTDYYYSHATATHFSSFLFFFMSPSHSFIPMTQVQCVILRANTIELYWIPVLLL